MKKTILLLCVVLLFASVGFAQSVTLTFTGRDGGNHHIEFEYVSVTNVTKGWQEYLFWPDTVLTIQNETGIHDGQVGSEFSLQMSSHSPNPLNSTTDVTLTVVEEGLVNLEIADMNGRVVVGANDYSPLPGIHQFRITLSHPGIYVMTARQNGKMSSVKMVCNNGGKANTVEYVGAAETFSRMSHPGKSDFRGHIAKPFDLGDQMQYVGYAIINYQEEESQCIEQSLVDSQMVVLPFSAIQMSFPTVVTANVTVNTDTSAICGGQVTDDGGDSMAVRGVCLNLSPSPTVFERHTIDGYGMGTFTSHLTGLSSNITYYVRAYVKNDLGVAYGEEKIFTIPVNPNGDVWSCPGTPLLTDIDGNVYNTVQIGQQCWMRENLRTKHYSDGTSITPGEGYSATVGYWYYPMNQSEYMSTYGLLYNWSATMHGANSSNSNPSGVQGICPDGWHVPSDAECTQLLNYVRSQSRNWCGGDSLQIGKSLAATVGWNLSGLDSCTVGNPNFSTNNVTGFGALPAGYCVVNFSNELEYGGLGYVTFYWTSTSTTNPYGFNDIYYWGFHANYALVIHNDSTDPNGDAQSVRCVKD